MDTKTAVYETIFALGLVGIFFSIFSSSFAFTSYSILEPDSELAWGNSLVLLSSIVLLIVGFYKLKNN